MIIPKKVPLHLRTSLFQLPIMINFEKERIKKFVTTQDRDAEGNTYETFKILESANFERGLNPKEMMDIGRDRSDAPDEQIFLRMHEEASKSPNFQYVTDINWKNEEPVFTIKSKKIITVKRTFRDYENEFREGYVNEPELFTIYLTKDQGITMFNDLTDDEYEDLTFKEFLSITNCRSIKESINFERGMDPKTAMDIGRAKYAFPVEDIYSRGMRIMPPEKADKYLRTVLPRRLKSVITRPGAVWEWPRFQDGLHYADAKWIMRQGYSGIKYRGTFYPFPEIEGYNFRREDEEWIDESVNFERGKDPKKSMDIGLEHKYGRMYNLFTICHNLSMNSDSFEWVSDIAWNPGDADHPYFNIDSFYYYTDEEDNKITEKFVVRLFPNYLEIFNVITEEEEEVRSVGKFIEITSAYEEDTAKELEQYLKDTKPF